MQLLITNQDYGPEEYGLNGDEPRLKRGNIINVCQDIHAWSAFYIQSMWLASDGVAFPNGVPDDLVGVERTAANFPNPHFAVARFPSYRCDLNLAEPWLEPDISNPEDNLGTYQVRPYNWYLDLDALPPGVRNSLEQPGGDAQLGANRLQHIKNFYDGRSITDFLGWEADTSKGDTPHRFPGIHPRILRGIS